MNENDFLKYNEKIAPARRKQGAIYARLCGLFGQPH